MYRKPSKRKQAIRLTCIYTVMVTAVILIAAFVTMLMLGYRFNANERDLEQLALLQFGSTPSGATVSIDGEIIGSKTPNKTSVQPGSHELVYWREGYETWRKTVNIKSAATVSWLNYALLVPSKITVEPITSFGSLFSSLSAPDEDIILVQKSAKNPVFDLVDVSSDRTKSTSLSLPINSYSAGSKHTFQSESWDSSSRYVLVEHNYGNKREWLVVDTQNVSETKNISKVFAKAIDSIKFFGSSGSKFYIISSGSLYKLNLADNPATSLIASNVIDFDIYEENNVITYTATSQTKTEKIAGIYRDGDAKPAVVRTTKNSSLHIATTKYFNVNYIAVSEGKHISILSGSYPNTTSDNANNLTEFASLVADNDVGRLEFNASGQFLLIQSGSYFASYDMEYQNYYKSQIPGKGDFAKFKWLDDNYLWTDRGGKLQILEFDGTNQHTINQVTIGQDVKLTNNNKYLYSFNKADSKYVLQRVRMILP